MAPRRTRTAPQHPASRAIHHRGMTLLEVVLAVLILGLVTASVASAMAFTLAMETRCAQRLGAYELANRLILLYLDDDRAVKQIEGRPLDYGKYRYRWELNTSRFEMKIKVAEAGSGRPRPQYLDRFTLIDVRVWITEELPGGFDRPGEMMAELTRLMDPFAARNPDAAKRMAAPDKIGGLLDLLTGGGAPQALPTPGTPRTGPGTPRPGGAGAPTGGGKR